MMNNIEDKVYLAVANGYTEKYFLSDDFAGLPAMIKDEIQIMLVEYVADIGGMIGLYFDEEGDLKIELTKADDDFFYDDIGAEYKLREIERHKRELFESLEFYYKSFVA